MLLLQKVWDHLVCGPSSEFLGFTVSSAGDWNKDGTPDLAAGAPGAGVDRGGGWRVFSGLDGALLHESNSSASCFQYGIAVSGGPGFDFDADGWVDLVVGGQSYGGYGPHGIFGGASVVSGRTGLGLAGTGWSVPGYSRETGPGYSVVAIPDFDLDGFSDFAASNPVARSILGPGVGEVVVISGRTRSIVQRITGTSSWDYLGYSIADVGDTDGDGASDLLIGAPAGEVPSPFGFLYEVATGGVVLVHCPRAKVAPRSDPGSW